MRTVRADPPVETGELDGLAWARFAPAGRCAPTAGVVLLHGADSRKESHFDFARACAGGGLAVLAFDARGHGESPGPLDGRAIDDVARMADLLRERAGIETVGLRGSSMGGYLALVAAAEARAAAVVAICPASAAGLSVGVRAQRFGFAVDRDAVVALLGAHDETEARPRPRRARCCCCTPRATRSCPSSSPARCTRRRRRPSSSSSPAATTARSSTTRSCRASRCASSAARCAADPGYR